MKYSTILFLFLIIIFQITTNILAEEINFSLIGQIPGGTCNVVAARDDYVFIGNGSALDILDISNPIKIESIGRVILPKPAKRFYIHKNYIFAVLKENGISIVDISQLNNPIEIKHWSTNTSVNDLEIYGNYAYLAESNDGFDIYDIQDPISPQKITHIDSTGIIVAIDVWENYLYLACRKDSYRLCVGSGPFKRCCTAYKFNGFRIFDLKNPILPIEIGKYQDQSWDPLIHSITDIKAQNGLAYISSVNFGIEIIDVSTPTSPIQTTSFWSAGEKILILDNYLYSFDHNVFNINEISNPNNSFCVNFLDKSEGGEQGNDFFVTEKHILIASRNGLLIYENTQNTKTKKLNFYKTGGYVDDIYIKNDFAYVLYHSNLISIYDINNLSSPELISNFQIPWTGDENDMQPTEIQVLGNYAYVACNQAGLHILDITNLTSVTEVGNYFGWPFEASDLCVGNDYTYVADFVNGLRILDTSNPKSPKEIKLIEINHAQVRDIHKQGDYIYLANTSDGFNIIAVSDPKNAKEIGVYNPGDKTIDNIFVNGNIVYVTHYAHGLDIFNVSDLETPEHIGSLYWQKPYEQSMDIIVEKSFAYIADRIYGLRVINIKNPLKPNEVGLFPIPSFTESIFISNDILYVVGAESGVYILKTDFNVFLNENTQPTNFYLYQNYPNPFNPATEIEYTIPAGNVKLEIFNMLGQKVQTLVDKKVMTGTHHVEWNGKNFSGNSVSSGIYLYRLESEDGVKVKKMLLQK